MYECEIPDPKNGTLVTGRAPYLQSRRSWLRHGFWGAMGTLAGTGHLRWSPPVAPLYFNGLYAYAHISHPPAIHCVVGAANQLVDKPYKWGGGHQVLFDNGFDCSGSISHVLFRSRLLDRPLNSSAFARYALPGPGSYLTLYVKPGHHVFMEVCGLRFDTTGARKGEGPRWRVLSRSRDGFRARHPAWL
ncbi:MAG: peptidoglycan endopeptidase [Prosthecobacter sp.]